MGSKPKPKNALPHLSFAAFPLGVHFPHKKAFPPCPLMAPPTVPAETVGAVAGAGQIFAPAFPIGQIVAVRSGIGNCMQKHWQPTGAARGEAKYDRRPLFGQSDGFFGQHWRTAQWPMSSSYFGVHSRRRWPFCMDYVFCTRKKCVWMNWLLKFGVKMRQF